MADVMCPGECLSLMKEVACPAPDFLERNGAWVLTVIGLGAGLMGTILTYMLRSRCTNIKCCGAECVRDVVKLDPKQITIEAPQTSEPVTE